MEHIARSAASMRSTESLGEWAGQPGPAEQTQHSNFDNNNLDHTSYHTKSTNSTSTSTHLSTKLRESTLKPPSQSHEPSRSPSPRPATLHLSPSATAARIASVSLAQPQTHIPETARMTKARRAPCCQWKHEDRKHSLHMSWLHHYTPSQTQ
jgi:hypothetical protein